MRWYITGIGGQLGCALQGRLAGEDDVRGSDLELDVADAAAVEAALRALPEGPPDCLVNAAAATHVDRCEREPAWAERINATAPAGLARVCTALGTKLVHVSTDYVFAGDGARPYREDDPALPASAYGRTKLAGEAAVRAGSDAFLVVRTSWLFGRGRNFIAAILEQAGKRPGPDAEPLRVVDDQRGRPTWAVDLADAIVHLVTAGEGGLFHVANAGVATWRDVARAALDHVGRSDLAIEPIATASLGLDAPRPAWSVLDTTKAETAGVQMRPWRDALRAFLDSDDRPAVAPGPVRNRKEEEEAHA